MMSPLVSASLSLLFLSILGPAAALPTAGQPSYSSGKASSYDLPLTWSPFGFLSEISIGTPPQKLPVFVDWTWISQYLLTTKCHHDPNRPYECLSHEQSLFNQSLSSSFKYETALYPSRTWNPNHFFFYNDLSVDHASDIVSVGTSTAKMIFQAADFAFDITSAPFPFAGVYGLSPVFKGDNASYQSPFYQAWKAGAWPSPLIAFHYCYNGSADTTKATCGGHDGLQTLGGYNRDLVEGDKIWWYENKVFPQVNTLDFEYAPPVYNYWAVELNRLSIGNETQPLNASSQPAAIFDHASYGRGVPLTVNAYRNLINLANARPITLSSPPNNGNQSWYQVDCRKAETLPPIRYQFMGHSKEWVVEARHYVEILQDGTCVLNVRTLADGDTFIGNFGETFSKDKYVVFDFEKLRVGLADVKW